MSSEWSAREMLTDAGIGIGRCRWLPVLILVKWRTSFAIDSRSIMLADTSQLIGEPVSLASVAMSIAFASAADKDVRNGVVVLPFGSSLECLITKSIMLQQRDLDGTGGGEILSRIKPEYSVTKIPTEHSISHHLP